MENPRFIKRRNAESFGGCQHFGLSVGSLVEGVLLKPRQSPACVRIKFSLLFGEDFVECLIDETQSSTYAHGRAVAFEYFLETRKHGHPRTNCSLSKIHRRDVALLEIAERVRQLLLQPQQELFSGSNGRRLGSWTTRKNYRRSQRVSSAGDGTVAQLASERPCSCHLEFRTSKPFQHSLPAS